MLAYKQGMVSYSKAFEVIERINDNMFKLDLLGECNISASFNVVDLSPFDVGKYLTINPFQRRENDENRVTKTSQDLFNFHRGYMRRTKKINEASNGLIEHISNSCLVQDNNIL